MKTPKLQNAFRLVSTQANEISLNTSILFDRKITDELNLDIGHGIMFSPEHDKQFVVQFEVKLKSEKTEFNIFIKYLALFECKDSITDDFRNSEFVNMNAPAIAFPYLRSFISSFVLESGYDPVILPTLNFASCTEK